MSINDLMIATMIATITASKILKISITLSAFIFLKGSDCCSETSISFHYTAPHEIYSLGLYLAERKQSNNGTYSPLNFDKIYKHLYKKG